MLLADANLTLYFAYYSNHEVIIIIFYITRVVIRVTSEMTSIHPVVVANQSCCIDKQAFCSMGSLVSRI